MEIFEDLKLNDIAKRPKIALIVDINGWAFENIAKQLKKYLSKYFEFKIVVLSHVEDLNMLIELTKDCELLHFFWRAEVLRFNEISIKEYTENTNINFENFINNLNISTAVYDHLYLDASFLSINKEIFKISPNYYVSSAKLYDIYSNLPFCNKPKVIAEDGVDLNLFKPININRLKNVSNREIVIGWSGNSKWACGLEDDFKGVETILKPAIEQLVYEGYSIKMHFADKNEEMIPHDEMVNYYSNIDLYVCTSKIEGTPNPILEAMACGIPIISTDVGIVPEVFGDKQKQFILKERSIECLKDAIKKIVSASKIFIELSEENLMQVQQWDWSIRVEYFKEFFKYCLKNKN